MAMGKKVYISKTDSDAFDLLMSIFQSACEAGGEFSKDEQEHDRIVLEVCRLAIKVRGFDHYFRESV